MLAVCPLYARMTESPEAAQERNNVARKKTGNPPMPAISDPKTKPVRLDLPPELHRLLRISAANLERSMSEHARHIVTEWLRDEANRKGPGR